MPKSSGTCDREPSPRTIDDSVDEVEASSIL